MLKCVVGVSLNGEYTGWTKGKNKFRNNHVNTTPWRHQGFKRSSESLVLRPRLKLWFKL
jgi:hypothetical protein